MVSHQSAFFKADIYVFSQSDADFTIFSDFLMFHQTFLSPQVKRSSIITYKHGKYEFPNELLNT